MSEPSPGWSPDQVVPLLRKVELFEGLPEEDLRRIAAIVKGIEVPEGEILFEEGEPGDAFYIVYRGAVLISKRRPDGSEDKLAVRRAGEGFGEMALVEDAPRSAGARAQETTRLMLVSREDFHGLLGGDSLALRMLQFLSKALRALGVRFASTERPQDRATAANAGALTVGRAMQAGFLPKSAPRLAGYDLAAGTTIEETGCGGSVWDWMEADGERVALVTLDVRGEGLPPAHHLGVARAVLRAALGPDAQTSDLLRRANDALGGSAVEGLDQFVQAGIMLVGPSGIEWAAAGRVPGGVIRRDGTFEQFGAQGPPLGVMPGFRYPCGRFEMHAGDAAFALSRASQGLFLGAADLIAQLHGKPAGEVVGTVHRAVRKAQGPERSETSVLYVRRH